MDFVLWGHYLREAGPGSEGTPRRERAQTYKFLQAKTLEDALAEATAAAGSFPDDACIEVVKVVERVPLELSALRDAQRAAAALDPTLLNLSQRLRVLAKLLLLGWASPGQFSAPRWLFPGDSLMLSELLFKLCQDPSVSQLSPLLPVSWHRHLFQELLGFNSDDLGTAMRCRELPRLLTCMAELGLGSWTSEGLPITLDSQGVTELAESLGMSGALAGKWGDLLRGAADAVARRYSKPGQRWQQANELAKDKVAGTWTGSSVARLELPHNQEPRVPGVAPQFLGSHPVVFTKPNRNGDSFRTFLGDKPTGDQPPTDTQPQAACLNTLRADAMAAGRDRIAKLRENLERQSAEYAIELATKSPEPPEPLSPAEQTLVEVLSPPAAEVPPAPTTAELGQELLQQISITLTACFRILGASPHRIRLVLKALHKQASEHGALAAIESAFGVQHAFIQAVQHPHFRGWAVDEVLRFVRFIAWPSAAYCDPPTDGAPRTPPGSLDGLGPERVSLVQEWLTAAQRQVEAQCTPASAPRVLHEAAALAAFAGARVAPAACPSEGSAAPAEGCCDKEAVFTINASDAVEDVSRDVPVTCAELRPAEDEPPAAVVVS